MHGLWTTSSRAGPGLPALLRPATRRRVGAARRLTDLLDPDGTGAAPPRRRHRARASPVAPGARRDAALSLGGGVLGLLLLGGAAGTAVGVVLALGLWRWLRTRPERSGRSAEQARERAVAEQLPLAAELLAACLAAGATPLEAARAVGDCLGGPLGHRLARACAELRLGADPQAAWGRVAALPGAAALARCLERAHSSGAPAVAPVARLAAESRAGRTRRAQARARRAGVLVTGPLALCFLPAFLLAGVAPVVIGLGRSLL
ncbi:type II secretion system F family protein [Streptomyces sp. WMMC1477]|uniref:type II secretion system F family protein n=1 Tax=Streptomyces sp. WMMC1477 TaxID=3015155 RepID=UPI0022B72D69|nr:type II secretion system F family protein [Streptomyces sp. WMMC1477]MCZ7432096.1 type II secretion system F family protein [Streptomyces sp. WMMC1477]